MYNPRNLRDLRDESITEGDTHDHKDNGIVNEYTNEAENEVENKAGQVSMDTRDYTNQEELPTINNKNRYTVDCSLSSECMSDIVAEIKSFDDGRKKENG